MKSLKLVFFLALCVSFFVAPVSVFAQHNSDRAGVQAAVLDYVEGIYEVAPERIERSVAKNLAKIGYWRQDASSEYRESPMSYEQLFALAGKWNAEGRVDPDTAPKEIEILDILDQTAVAKLTADWGIDYLNLAKKDGKWMIVNVLWQSHPPNTP